MREGVRNYLDNPPTLKVKIDNFQLSGRSKFDDYYAETIAFTHDVPQNSKLRKLFVPASSHGSSRAVSAGWWLLLRPPNQITNRSITFEGEAKNGYHTSATYDLKYVSRT